MLENHVKHTRTHAYYNSTFRLLLRLHSCVLFTSMFGYVFNTFWNGKFQASIYVPNPEIKEKLLRKMLNLKKNRKNNTHIKLN